MNKRGVFYLLISTIFVLLAIVIFVSYKQYKLLDKQKVVETRILTVNDFLRDMEFDSKRVIYVSGFRSLIALEDYVAKSGSYVEDPESMFRDTFYTGLVNGSAVEIMQNSSYSDYLAKLDQIASKVGLTVFVNVTNITLYHDSPWSVNVIVTATVNLTDKKGLARWDFVKDYSTTVSLQNIRDPLYSVSTYGKMPNTIRQANTTDFVDGSDTTNLQIHINNSYYIKSDNAPSFLMRLQGNFSSSPYGIESLVHVPELIVQGVAYDADKPIVDYLLFTNITSYNYTACNIENLSSWVKIDDAHIDFYEIDQLNYTLCP